METGCFGPSDEEPHAVYPLLWRMPNVVLPDLHHLEPGLLEAIFPLAIVELTRERRVVSLGLNLHDQSCLPMHKVDPACPRLCTQVDLAFEVGETVLVQKVHHPRLKT